jgi:chorismate mutase
LGKGGIDLIRGIRGATTITHDTAETIHLETERLIIEMAKTNRIEPEQVASVIISTTTDIPVMCTHEMDVPGAMGSCIRILMHVNTELSQKELHHVYLNEAVTLRPDLVK